MKQLTLETKHSGLSRDNFKMFGKRLAPYIRRLQGVAASHRYEEYEGSINLSYDTNLMRAVKRLKNKLVSRKLKYVIVIGIGGSNLGTKAVYDVLYGCSDTIKRERYPKLLFFDTVSQHYTNELVSFLKKEITHQDEILVNVISKSGTTTETIANVEIVYAVLTRRFQNIANRIVVTTDYGSALWHAARHRSIATLTIPDTVGGRYSVFSSVGLFPLSAAGVDVNALRKGARSMVKLCLKEKIRENPAARSAAFFAHHSRKGKSIADTFLFHSELESVGKWYRQLMGESIGKEKDIKGNIVHAGITPTVSIGSTDLHSVGQLYLGGPRDKMTTFVMAESASSLAVVPKRLFFSGLVPAVAGRTPEEIMSAIYRGVTIAYQKQRLPFVTVTLPDIFCESIGAFLQYKMIEIMMLGFLMKVNAFDQPNVELYKKETRKILKV